MSDAPETCFMQGAGGTIFKMDIPTSAIAKERWDEAIAKGDLVPVEHAELVTHADGSQHWVNVDAPEPKPKTPPNKAGRAAAAPRGGKKAAPTATSVDPSDEPDFADPVEPNDDDE